MQELENWVDVFADLKLIICKLMTIIDLGILLNKVLSAQFLVLTTFGPEWAYFWIPSTTMANGISHILKKNKSSLLMFLCIFIQCKDVLQLYNI